MRYTVALLALAALLAGCGGSSSPAGQTHTAQPQKPAGQTHTESAQNNCPSLSKAQCEARGGHETEGPARKGTFEREDQEQLKKTNQEREEELREGAKKARENAEKAREKFQEEEEKMEQKLRPYEEQKQRVQERLESEYGGR